MDIPSQLNSQVDKPTRTDSTHHPVGSHVLTPIVRFSTYLPFPIWNVSLLGLPGAAGEGVPVFLEISVVGHPTSVSCGGMNYFFAFWTSFFINFKEKKCFLIH